VECIRNTLDTRAQYYEEEVKKLSENRVLPGWNFVGFHMVKVSKSTQILYCGPAYQNKISLASSGLTCQFMGLIALLHKESLIFLLNACFSTDSERRAQKGCC
jgi:hypothetical protein